MLTSCDSETPPDIAEINPDSVALAGGILTQSYGITSKMLLTYPPTLTGQFDFKKHRDGNSLFMQQFIPLGPKFYGLGPVYSSAGCFRCHINAGRGRPFGVPNQEPGMMLRISRSGIGPDNGPDTVPGFGVVLQQLAWIGRQREGDIKVGYDFPSGYYGDGESYQLRALKFRVDIAADHPYIMLPEGTLTSARIAAPLIGLGLLENIPESDILNSADPNDGDGDGISGRPNLVQNSLTLSQTLGRFGWKAGIATVYEHTAYDFNQAIGVTSTLGIYARESCRGQPQEKDVPFDDPEIQGNASLSIISFFLKTTAVPGRRNMNADQIRRGQKLFADASCAKCHTPKQRTGNVEDIPLISNQTFYPYTDLLLHDMGDGLADGYRDFEASGNEWRTAPLWGIGLTETINDNAYYLHDGRAQTLEEAILWHGGEAEQSKQFFLKLPKSDRDALIAFLRSL